MGMDKFDRQVIGKAIHGNTKGPKTTVYELEDIVDMLAKLDDKGHSRKKVYLESPEGERIPISFIQVDRDDDVIVIG